MEPTNIAMAFGVIVVLLALCTPIADPRRLSVNDQLARLRDGKVSAEAFDYLALRFDDGRFGRRALDLLQHDPNPVIKGKAVWAARLDSKPYEPAQTAAPDRFKKTTVYPKGQTLPKSFVDQAWGREDEPDCRASYMDCEATLLDTDGDGVAEVLLSSSRVFDIYKVDAAGLWSKKAETTAFCGDVGEALKAGDLHVAPSLPGQDLVVGGKRLRIDPAPSCRGGDVSVEQVVVTGEKKP